MKKGKSEESARKICGALQRDTEEQCKRKAKAEAKPAISRREFKEQIAMLERRVRVIRDVLTLSPGSSAALCHAEGIRRERDLLTAKRTVDSGKWETYSRELRAELPAVEAGLEQRRAALADLKLPPARELSLKLKVRHPESEDYAMRHVNLNLTIPQSRALLAVQHGISSDHLTATSADAVRYLLDQLAESLC